MLNDLLAKNQSSDKLYVEDVFSTWLYTGTGASQTIANGIDLAGKGGLVWIKSRSATANNVLVDTVRGAYANLSSNLTSQSRGANTVTNFNSTGFTVTNDTSDATFMNTTGVSGTTYASWTFRKAPKFFDVVTYTGNGTSQNINHSLGSVPGMVIVKRTNSTSDWVVGHRRSGPNYWSQGTLRLNTTAASVTNGEFLAATDTYIGVVNSGASYGDVNTNGATYVAYLFAHDTTADGVIQCGSYTGNGSAIGPTITLGWEPQFLLVKGATETGGSNWLMFDNMRGLPVSGNGQQLIANSSGAEGGADRFSVTATGFNPINNYTQSNLSGQTYIYMAIRRGPMRTPTSGTSVFDPIARSGTGGTGVIVSSTITPDTVIVQKRNATSYSGRVYDRLRGVGYVAGAQNDSNQLITSSTAAEGVISNALTRFDLMNSFGVNGDVTVNGSGGTYINWAFRRAPSFFDTVCYTGTGSNTTQSHNLGVVPELIIIKRRSTTGNWTVQSSYLPNGFSFDTGTGTYGYAMNLNLTGAAASQGYISGVTSTVFNPSTGGAITNNLGTTYVAYLFASCPGVSKVGSYTGTGTTQQINCGFTNGARFVLIKRTDSTGDWYVYDSARGIIAGNDPYLLLNSTAAEVTNTDYIDAYSAGFELSSTAPAALNASGGTYIYLAIA